MAYKRQLELWLVETMIGDGETDIPCIGATLTLDQIYDGLEFQADTTLTHYAR